MVWEKSWQALSRLVVGLFTAKKLCPTNLVNSGKKQNLTYSSSQLWFKLSVLQSKPADRKRRVRWSKIYESNVKLENFLDTNFKSELSILGSKCNMTNNLNNNVLCIASTQMHFSLQPPSLSPCLPCTPTAPPPLLSSPVCSLWAGGCVNLATARWGASWVDCWQSHL